ncbi:MAG: hypothetical protein ABR583_01775 [Gaiellaceae bacterium]
MGESRLYQPSPAARPAPLGRRNCPIDCRVAGGGDFALEFETGSGTATGANAALAARHPTVPLGHFDDFDDFGCRG